MEKKIRSYHITTGRDIKVTDFTTDPGTDISARYQSIARDDVNIRVDAFIDVYESEDGQLRCVRYHNDKNRESCASLRVLLKLYTSDVERGEI